MNPIKGLLSLTATVAIAAVVAYSVSAPRNVNAFMNQDMDALGGKSMNEHMAETQASVRSEQCEQLSGMAEDAWSRAMEQGTADRDADQLEEMDRQAERFCN